MPHSAAWPLAACILIGAASGAGERGGLPSPHRSARPDTLIVEPSVPIAGAGTCARFSGDADRECVSLYRAVLMARVRRAPPDGTAGRWG